MYCPMLTALLTTILACSVIAQGNAAPGGATGADTQVDPKTAARQQRLAEEKAKAPPRATSSKLDMRKLKTGNQPVRPRAVTVAPEDANLSPDEIRAKYKNRLGAAYVDYKTHCEPAVLAPGEHGKIVVYFVLKNDAVMPPQGPKSIDFLAAQGSLTLDPVQIRPAGPARIAAGFRGKTAYDDFIVAEIPVVVDPAAPEGLQTVQLTFDYELYSGTTAGWIEKFRDHVSADVRVKKAAGAAAVAAPSTEPAPRAASNAVAAPSMTQDPLAGADAAGKEVEGPGAEVGTDGSPLFWVLGAAGAVLGGAVLLLGRRR
jgi:hypothetical protein